MKIRILAALSLFAAFSPLACEEFFGREQVLEFGENLSVSRAGAVYRVESFGDTRIQLKFLNHAKLRDLSIAVISPDGTRGVFGSSTDSLELTFKKPGVYKIALSHPYGHSVGWQAECMAGCAHPVIKAPDLVHELKRSGKVDQLLKHASAHFSSLGVEPALQLEMLRELRQAAASADPNALNRFPEVPLGNTNVLKSLLGAIGTKPKAPPQALKGKLEDLLSGKLEDLLSGKLEDIVSGKPAELSSGKPADLVEALGESAAPIEAVGKHVETDTPDLAYAQFPNRALTDEQVTQSPRLAHLLNSLAAGIGAEATVQGFTAKTPSALIGALISSGHQVELREEVTFANFLSMTYQGQDVYWPVWMDTHIPLQDGKALAMPTGHSQFTWYISGPVVNARVSFFLGIGGVGFFPQLDLRPAWSGLKAIKRVESGPEGTKNILKAIETATTYFQRNKNEGKSVAKGLPQDGYVYVGVCNDSTGLLEKAVFGTLSVFPLVRACNLDQSPALNDGLDELIRALPHDGAGITDRHDALRRAWLMNPHDLNSPNTANEILDEQLRAQLLAVKAELGE